jgi:hypothetical protein
MSHINIDPNLFINLAYRTQDAIETKEKNKSLEAVNHLEDPVVYKHLEKIWVNVLKEMKESADKGQTELLFKCQNPSDKNLIISYINLHNGIECELSDDNVLISWKYKK